MFTACGIIAPKKLPAGDTGAIDCVYSLWYNALQKLPAGDTGVIDCVYSLWYNCTAEVACW